MCRWNRAPGPRAPNARPDAPASPVPRSPAGEPGGRYCTRWAKARSTATIRPERLAIAFSTTAVPLMADRNVASLALSGGTPVDRLLRSRVSTWWTRAWSTPFITKTTRSSASIGSWRTRNTRAPRWLQPTGLVLFDSGGEPRQVMGRKDGLLSDHVTDVAFRDGGHGGGHAGGPVVRRRAGVRSLYVFHGLVNNHVYTVAARGQPDCGGNPGRCIGARMTIRCARTIRLPIPT